MPDGSILDAGIIQKILATMADDAIINLLLSSDTAVQRMLKKQKKCTSETSKLDTHFDDVSLQL